MVLAGVAGLCDRYYIFAARPDDERKGAARGLKKKKAVAANSSLVIGLIVAIISGMLSACFNFGIEAGKPMADVANDVWKAAIPARVNFYIRIM